MNYMPKNIIPVNKTPADIINIMPKSLKLGDSNLPNKKIFIIS